MDEKNANAFTASEEETLDLLNMVPSQERAPKRKIGFAIIPYCSLLYLLNFLGRVNIDQAVLTGLQKDLHLKENQYDIALTVFFVSPDGRGEQFRRQHDSCSASPKVSLLPFFNCTTGSPRVSRDYFPLTTWYNRNEQNWAISLFFAGTSLAGGCFWRNFGVRYLTHGPCRWEGRLVLDNPEGHQQRTNAPPTCEESWCHRYISVSQPLYSVGLFTPTIIKELGLLQWGIFIIGGMLAVIVGYIILLTNASTGVKYCCNPCIATSITLIGNNYGPVYTRAVAVGFFISVGNCAAGIISSYPSSTVPRNFRERKAQSGKHRNLLAFDLKALAPSNQLRSPREYDRRDRLINTQTLTVLDF
ncbi:hypothetical protein BS47DRAFT_1454705 [Hydnum rufescens UP504]|uniref:Uncharacterized protein n=1 Tax=Hydnum rufescens UP504 TaxID=1448309 RepID=A0A9P6AYH3_9AGAM|nr:hypothetical protein BS47DRAFT_1454705 [Hydnum rufescens UP504]